MKNHLFLLSFTLIIGTWNSLTATHTTPGGGAAAEHTIDRAYTKNIFALLVHVVNRDPDTQEAIMSNNGYPAHDTYLILLPNAHLNLNTLKKELQNKILNRKGITVPVESMHIRGPGIKNKKNKINSIIPYARLEYVMDITNAPGSETIADTLLNAKNRDLQEQNQLEENVFYFYAHHQDDTKGLHLISFTTPRQLMIQGNIFKQRFINHLNQRYGTNYTIGNIILMSNDVAIENNDRVRQARLSPLLTFKIMGN